VNKVCGSGTNIKGFTIANGDYGIPRKKQNCIITNNNINNNSWDGIYIYHSSNKNTIYLKITINNKLRLYLLI